MGSKRNWMFQGLRAAVGGGLLFALFLVALAGRGQEPDQAAKKAKSDRPPFDLTYVPDGASGVLALRPNAIFHDPAMKPLTRMANESMLSLADLKLPVQEIEQVVFYIHSSRLLHFSELSMSYREAYKRPPLRYLR